MLRDMRERFSGLHRITGQEAPGALELLEPVLLRYSGDEDKWALQRLAALDSRRLPEGSFLLAEVDGELLAAAPLDSNDEPLSDPFRPTATPRDLLRLRGRDIRGGQGSRSVGRAHRGPSRGRVTR